MTSLASTSAPRNIGSICHNEDDPSDPAHRRIILWIGHDGAIWADAANPHLADLDKPTDIHHADVICARAYCDPCWDYRSGAEIGGAL